MFDFITYYKFAKRQVRIQAMFWHMSCEFESESLLGGAINNTFVVGIHPILRVEKPQRTVIERLERQYRALRRLRATLGEM
jgi:hypothetical protein